MWMYRDFTGSPVDKHVEDISFRFGVTCWPQHFLIEPESLAELADTGRTVESFLAAVDRAKVKPIKMPNGKDRLVEAWNRLVAFNSKPSLKAAERLLLHDEDIVVRHQAFLYVVARAPNTVAQNADQLLRVPHDPFRYHVCESLEKVGAAQAKGSLESLVANPKNSRNPNVLRCKRPVDFMSYWG